MAAFHRARVEIKADGSEVTPADRDAQAVLVEELARHFPGTAVVGEEGARVSGDRGTWYVDPIDGTAAFLEGLAAWGPTVCLVEGGALRLGAWLSPLTGEFWFAARGDGAWRNGERLRPAPLTALTRNHAVFVSSRFHRLPAVPWQGKVRALGSTAAHLAYTAAGGPVAAVVGRWHLWDVGCGALLVREAGREIVDLTGARYDPVDETGPPFLAGDPLALERLLEVLPPRRGPDR